MEKDNDAERLASLLAGTPDMQATMLIATKSMTQNDMLPRGRGLVNDPRKDACSRTDVEGPWVLEHILQHPAAADEESSFSEGCPSGCINL